MLSERGPRGLRLGAGGGRGPAGPPGGVGACGRAPGRGRLPRRAASCQVPAGRARWPRSPGSRKRAAEGGGPGGWRVPGAGGLVDLAGSFVRPSRRLPKCRCDADLQLAGVGARKADANRVWRPPPVT